MKIIIPIDSESSGYIFDIELSKIAYKIDAQWNVRGEFWTINLLDSKGALICSGVPRTNYPLFFRYSDDRLPPGDFYVTDQTEKNLEINRENFGKEIILSYDDLLE